MAKHVIAKAKQIEELRQQGYTPAEIAARAGFLSTAEYRRFENNYKDIIEDIQKGGEIKDTYKEDLVSDLKRQLAEKERELAELEKNEQELINKLVSYGFDEQALKKMLEKLDADLNLESEGDENGEVQ